MIQLFCIVAVRRSDCPFRLFRAVIRQLGNERLHDAVILQGRNKNGIPLVCPCVGNNVDSYYFRCNRKAFEPDGIVDNRFNGIHVSQRDTKYSQKSGLKVLTSVDALGYLILCRTLEPLPYSK
jgi:hypothetical protein